MEFSCTKSEMTEILNIVQKAVSVKSTTTIIECIKIDCFAGEKAVFTGNNTELCIEYESTDIDIKTGGSIALESKMFGDIIRKLPEGIIHISVDEENNITKITGGISEFNIKCVIANEFPPAPQIDEIKSFSIEEGVIREILRKVNSFIAVNEGKRPVLTGALFDIKDGKLTVAASDGHRLAVVKEDVINGPEDTKIIIPGATIRELLKILKTEDNIINIIISDRYAMLRFENFKVFTRLIEGDFLKYEPIIAANNTIKMEVKTDEMRDALERAMLIINDEDVSPDKRMPVRLSVGFDKIEISCMNQKGKINDEIPAKIEGGSVVIGFNCRFLIDAISACDEEYIEIGLSTPTSGCFLKSIDEKFGNYVFMVLPVRLYN